jgi:putative phosphoribosyl transferase
MHGCEMTPFLSDTGTRREIEIKDNGAVLEGDLIHPAGALGVIVFAHGSGSSRFSTRNRFVAAALHGAGLATVLLDLLTDEEEAVDVETAEHRFNVPLLARRLVRAIDWLEGRHETRDLPVGLFGASTGTGAALIAATARSQRVRAVVSRGGRPELAGAALAEVEAPTLLIVGGADQPVIALNEAAMQQMRCVVELRIVPKASHLFEEPGTLERVAGLARSWFLQHLVVTEKPAP